MTKQNSSMTKWTNTTHYGQDLQAAVLLALDMLNTKLVQNKRLLLSS